MSDSSGEIIDQLTIENLPPDTSLGVYVNNPDPVILSETTPGYQNSNNYFTGAIIETVFFSNNGGFLSESVNLSLSGNSSGQVIRYTHSQRQTCCRTEWQIWGRLHRLPSVSHNTIRICHLQCQQARFDESHQALQAHDWPRTP